MDYASVGASSFFSFDLFGGMNVIIDIPRRLVGFTSLTMAY